MLGPRPVYVPSASLDCVPGLVTVALPSLDEAWLSYAARVLGDEARIQACAAVGGSPEHPGVVACSDPRFQGQEPPRNPGRFTGSGLAGVRPLVPALVHLPVSLAGPGPSGSTDPPRRCQGCSRPPLHLQGQAALSFNEPLRRLAGGVLSSPHGHTAPRGARQASSRDRSLPSPPPLNQSIREAGTTSRVSPAHDPVTRW